MAQEVSKSLRKPSYSLDRPRQSKTAPSQPRGRLRKRKTNAYDRVITTPDTNCPKITLKCLHGHGEEARFRRRYRQHHVLSCYTSRTQKPSGQEPHNKASASRARTSTTATVKTEVEISRFLRGRRMWRKPIESTSGCGRVARGRLRSVAEAEDNHKT